MYLSFQEIAQLLLMELGGSENLLDIKMEKDRLSLKLANRKMVREEALSKIPNIIGIIDDRTYFAVLAKPEDVTAIGQELLKLKENNGQVPSFWQKLKNQFQRKKDR